MSTYVAPNYNIDGDTNVAGLTALKGSAPALTDKIWVYNLAVLTIEQALSILQIRLGETSSGAAGAGNRRGDLVVDPGVTITFAGVATPSSGSGVYSYPASADASSKGIVVQLNGTAASRITLTNQGGAINANQRWQLYLVYGIAPVVSNVDFEYSYDAIVMCYFTYAAYSDTPNGDLTVTNCTVTGIYTSAASAIALPGATAAYTGTIDIDIRSWDLTGAPNNFLANTSITAVVRVSTGRVAVRGCNFLNAPAQFSVYPLYAGGAAGADLFTDTHNLAPTDIRQTEVVPTGLAFTDPATGGELRFTITNAASYADGDQIVIYNNAGDAELGRVTKAKYTADG